MRICTLVLIIIANISLEISAQSFNADSVKINPGDYNLPQTSVDYSNILLLSGASAALGTALHIYYNRTWWKEKYSIFSVTNHSYSSQNINKAARFYSTNLVAHFYSASLEGAGVNYEKATIYSALIGLSYGLYLETFDGFSKHKFSTIDMAFNLAGAAYVLGQYYLPVLKNFQPRFSYYPSNEYNTGRLPDKNVFSDYGGQKYWVGIRVKEFLPEFMEDYWPSFLMISAGIGVKSYSSNRYSENEFFIAFDLDAEEIPLYGSFWQFIKNTLNYFHFPMPGIRITPDTAAFLLCY